MISAWQLTSGNPPQPVHLKERERQAPWARDGRSRTAQQALLHLEDFGDFFAVLASDKPTYSLYACIWGENGILTASEPTGDAVSLL